MIKKVLAFVLVLSLIPILVSGCKNSDNTTESTAPIQSSPAQSTSAPDSNSSEIFKFDPATGTVLGFMDTVTGITDIVIPAEINGVTVRRIGDNAFNYRGLTSVVMPDSVEYIGSNSFKENKLIEIALPLSLKEMGIGAFWKNMLTEITIPEGITRLPVAAFRDNEITKITFPESLTIIGRGAFLKNMLTELNLPGTVKILESTAFENNQIETLVLNEGLEEICGFAFEKNSLSELTIPASVKLIGRVSEGAIPALDYQGSAFRNNSLTKVTILGNDTEIDEFMMGANNYFRDAYYEGGAGTYEGEQLGPWKEVSDN
ncbi:MAG: leucine-rich repeat domain-containing protein [Bacteroidales bacterium]|nr:leucine-rich repeat domain-containing protein [Bacteroidales bacterium]